MLFLNPRKSTHKEIKSPQALKIAVNKSDGWNRAINPNTSHFKTHILIRLCNVRVDAFMDDMETMIAELGGQTLGLMPGWEGPKLMRQQEQPWSGSFGRFAQACCTD